MQSKADAKLPSIPLNLENIKPGLSAIGAVEASLRGNGVSPVIAVCCIEFMADRLPPMA